MDCQIKCSKGTKPEDVISLKFEGKDLAVTDSESTAFLSLADVRKRLIEENFIGKDREEYVWRFVASKVKGDEKGNVRYSDRIIATLTEELYPAKKLIINNENELIITNVEAVGRPDLIGFATDYFNNGKLKVTCRLRDYMEGDSQKNAGKFQPLMITDLISVREEDDINYKFVCVCCEDSIVEFPVESFGSIGFAIKAELNNEIIYDSGVRFADGEYDQYGKGTVNCIRRDGKTFDIVVKNLTKDTSMVPGQAIRYQKITIYTQDLLSWHDLDTNKEITADEVRAKDRNNARMLRVGRPAANLMGTGKRAMQTDDNSHKTQITLPGGSYDPGKIEEGQEVTFQYGRWCLGKVSESRLGSVNIYMFVFKTREEAEKVIGRYNSLTESKQARYWGIR